MLLNATYLMLLIIVPVMLLVVVFAWKYRASNRDAVYEPEWSHSTRLELVIWAAPLLIVICLGGLTWVGTHLLDPYRPLDRISADKIIEAEVAPLEVEVVSLDWKWLFIYPQYGIATVNELAAPVDRPIEFKLTSSSVMNAFYVPTLAGMIYTMPGMQTMLHGVVNAPGVYDGFSSNYSGAGFSGMRFKFHALSDGEFDAWVAEARKADATLNAKTYLTLAEPSENVAPAYYSSVGADLYHDILNLCVEPGRMCMDQMMAHDANEHGGPAAGHSGMKHMDGKARPEPAQDETVTSQPVNRGKLRGHGLSRDRVPLFGPAPKTSTHDTL